MLPYPHTYVVPRTPIFPNDVNDWQRAPWSTPFGDITGDPEAVVPDTRFRALWDDDYLYFLAQLEPSPDFGTQAHFTERNSPIYQKDSDFEVFIDPTGTHHNYLELEVNALNTVWNLKLDKPYDDGGHEHSGRVARPGEPDYYDVNDQITATRVVHGSLNAEKGALWTVQIAWSWEDLGRKPALGDYWKINFSRVEKEGDVNWTWQPQRVWDPVSRSYQGRVNMHLPDSYGYFVLAEESGSTGAPPDPTFLLRQAAMSVYYAQRYHKEQTGGYSDTLDDLILDESIVGLFDVDLVRTGDGYTVYVEDVDYSARIREDRLIEVSAPVSNVTGFKSLSK